MTWQEFALEHRGARADHVAAIVGQPASSILALRARTSAGGTPKHRPNFLDLFTRWHGRPPRDSDWPPPRRAGGQGYEWQAPELALLARLAGRTSVPEIAATLTARLRRLTGDSRAVRDRHSVQGALNQIGLQASELLGGLSVGEAARRLAEMRKGTLTVVQQAVHAGTLRSFRIGHRHVIPVKAFEEWAAKRDAPPAGWVRLASMTKPLGISSDSKLPEYAKLGYIDGAVFVRSCHLWFIDPKVARRIIDDAHHGRPLPWHGKPFPTNTRHSWEKWRRRRHRWCRMCTTAWGAGGTPRTYADFARRYPPIDLGLKRHMTRPRSAPWRPRRPWGACRSFRGLGITIAEAARQLGKTKLWVWAQIRRGVARPLRDPQDKGQPLRISPPGMVRLRRARGDELRGRPPGQWLGDHAAAVHAGVSITQVAIWRRQGLITSKRGPRGWLFGVPTLERQARRYWATCRYKRKTPPAWIQVKAA